MSIYKQQLFKILGGAVLISALIASAILLKPDIVFYITLATICLVSQFTIGTRGTILIAIIFNGFTALSLAATQSILASRTSLIAISLIIIVILRYTARYLIGRNIPRYTNNNMAISQTEIVDAPTENYTNNVIQNNNSNAVHRIHDNRPIRAKTEPSSKRTLIQG